MTEIANLSVVIGADISKLTRGLADTSTKLTSFGTSASTALMGVGAGFTMAGTKLTSFGSNITSAMAPLTGLVSSGIEAAAGFESIMTQLETFGGLAGDELELVRQKALDMGAATMFSASDAADAMLGLVKSGMSTAEAMASVDAAMTLAAAGEIGVADAATIVSTALAQFGIDTEYAGDVVDVLAAAANVSAASVQSIADGLANVGPVAHAAGLNVAETAAALAVMSNAGIQGAEAGTQLKSLLLNLQGDTATEQMHALGLSLYDAAGKTRDFDDVLDDLAVILKDKTPEEQAGIMQNLAGSYGITALNALLAADGIDGTLDAMTKAPAAATLAQSAMGTFSGKVEGLQGSIETLMIEALTPLMNDVLKPLVDEITKVINSVTAWAKENPLLASTIGGIVLGIGFLGTAAAIAGPLLGILGGGFTAIGVGLRFALGPVGLLIMAVGLLAAVINDPTIQAGLAAWEGVFTNASIIITAILDDLGTKIRTMVRDVREAVMAAQVIFAEGQINLGFRVEENTAFLEGMGAEGAGLDIVKKFETGVQGYLDGETVNLDIGGLDWALTGAPDPATGAVAPEGMKESILANFTDPAALSEAINMALASNDQAALSILVPIATELGIDTEALWEQFAAKAQAAADLEAIAITAQADVTVNPHSIDLSPIMAGIGAAGVNSMGFTNSLPALDGGGMITSTGAALLHAGEQVLNPAQTAAYNGQGGGGGGNSITFAPSMSVDQMLSELARMGIYLKPGMNAA